MSTAIARPAGNIDRRRRFTAAGSCLGIAKTAIASGAYGPVQVAGVALCVAGGAITAGDYVKVGSTVTAGCHPGRHRHHHRRRAERDQQRGRRRSRAAQDRQLTRIERNHHGQLTSRRPESLIRF